MRCDFPHISPMCGRYASYLPPDAIARLFGTVNPLPNVKPTWNMAPTQDAMVVRRDEESGHRHLDILKWGLIPWFTKDLKSARKPINARCETVAKTPMFKDAFAKRRCLVPVTAYYEWRHDPFGKNPFAIAYDSGEPIAFGGVWDEWRSPDGETLRTFATMTRDANPELALIQERMPVIIEKTDWRMWLGEEDGDVGALMRPLPADRFRVWPVGRAVNSVKNDGPELIEPLPAPDLAVETPPEPNLL